MGKESISPLIGLRALAAATLLLGGCAGGSTTPPATVEKEAIIITVNGTYNFSGQPISGTIAVEGPGINATGAIGSPVNLGDFDKGTTKNCTIKVYAAGGHPFYFKNVPLVKTQTLSGIKILGTSAIDVPLYIDQMTTNNMNSTCTSPSINGFYSTSFTPVHVAEFTTQLKKLAGWMGKPCTVGPKDLPLSGDVPTGEYWSVDTPGEIGLGSFKYPYHGNVVTSAKMVYDQSKIAPVGLIREVVKLFKQNAKGITIDEATAARWFYFATNLRPQGEDKNYLIYTDHEEMTGLPTDATLQTMEHETISVYQGVPTMDGVTSSMLVGNSNVTYEYQKTGEVKVQVPPHEMEPPTSRSKAPRKR